jgi:hypothetical protein
MDDFVRSFARGMKVADGLALQAASARSGKLYQPGIGPHTEPQTIRLALANSGDPILESAFREVTYPATPQYKCDVVMPAPNAWAIEVKMLRLMGDNGKLNDNALMHVLSPYSAHRSAVTDCPKLLGSGLDRRKGIVIFGYDHKEWPMDPVIEAFEILASRSAEMARSKPAAIADLIHPVHRAGRVFGWEITARAVWP